MTSSRFLLPITLCGSSGQQSSSTPSSVDIIETSCSRANPTCVVSWSLDSRNGEVSYKDNDRGQDVAGVALGCADGTVYIFHAASRPEKHRSQEPNESQFGSAKVSLSLRPSSPTRRSKLAQSKSRSTSPSSVTSGLAPFSVSSRSRIVSGLSLEQAEAPKNYVDFEEEPEKLKDMLKGKGPKEKSTAPEGPPSQSPSRLLRSPWHVSSTLSSSLSTSRSMSRAPSPTLSTADATPPPASSVMSLKLHICPQRFGEGHAVSSVEIIHDSQELLCLQESGYLSVHSLQDGSCTGTLQIEDEHSLAPPDGIKPHDMSYHVWSWKRMQVITHGEKTLVLVCANDPTTAAAAPSVPGDYHSSQDDVSEVTRLAIFELRRLHEHERFNTPVLEKVGEWCVDGPLCGHRLCETGSEDDLALLHITPSRHLVMRSLRLSSPAPNSLHASLAENESSTNNSLTSLPLPNPFKALKIRSSEHVAAAEPEKRPGKIVLGEELDLGEISFGEGDAGVIAGVRVCYPRAVIWSDSTVIALDLDLTARTMSPVGSSISIPRIEDVGVSGLDSFVAVCDDRAEVYTIRTVDPNNDEVTGEERSAGSSAIHAYQLSRTMTLPDHSANHIIFPDGILLATRDETGRRMLQLTEPPETSRVAANSKGRVKDARSTILWKAKRQPKDNELSLTALLPLELNLIITGYSDGYIKRSSLASLAADWTGSSAKRSDAPLNAAVMSLFAVHNRRTSSRILVGGGDDGSVACWDFSSLALTARWTLFITPLRKVIEAPDSGCLKDCILCIAHDGTVAVIAIDGCQFLYLIPGSIAPLEHMYFDSQNILLVYAHGWARLWDLRTQEFRRSVAWDKAADIVAQDKEWMEMPLNSGDEKLKEGTFAGALSVNSFSPDAASTLLVDLEILLGQLVLLSQASGEKQRQSSVLLTQSRTILSTFLTFGLSPDIDAICQEGLGVQPCGPLVGLMSRGTFITVDIRNPRSYWTVSSDVSAARALAIIALLRSLALFEDLTDNANTVIAFYASSLGALVGPAYQVPSPVFLANAWFNASSELRAAIHLLFDAGLACLSDEETNRIIDTWQPSLPYLQPEERRLSHTAAMALFLCGYIAVSKYSLLSATTLSDISKSIAFYLHDETSNHRALAIDLCSRGFTVWQQYVDAMEMLRALFVLATTSRKESISTQNAGLLARSAVLRIASSNSPLFMTTLAFDILHPKDVEHRKSVMQLVAFFIRKQPLVLYPNLPRLVEAVVKSLDPNSTANREAVLDTATEILGHVVKTFPTVDFHMATQRLAVGTSEGAVIMYDLKTATRLYVLEGHKKRLVACSFSPDGRRLVTVSLEESTVLVWKVGSSFSSFFNPGAPPRQGHSGSEPFKRLSFNVGDEAKMTIAGTLEFIRFEWPADRSVKLKIRDSTLTFST
ncbi:WD40 repeat-like protein [Gloeophyllum trabeum ATCC 11539]|uniref:WD40 repeat-like protein n=1 Tax=Gloeophyllum trabeum (strain ATCC 11539 / FP-39264 / Madison 617) TaxID=670483 RepID=S7Q5T1_GLOTA|nr:WD40 repeat-like protein [Gloeophyllum trabeum ATCC 11539]EPQ54828.1 WD40 repeat-like protein [Gloeophyllum trabeum ATCC 11539]